MGHIELRTEIRAPVERCFDLSRDLDLHMESMAASRERAVAGRTSGLIEAGESVTWEAGHLGKKWRMTSRITEFQIPSGFVDEMVEGPFDHYRHEHEFAPTENGTLMIDRVDFAGPLGVLGRIVDVLFLDRYLRGLLKARNSEIKRRAEAF